MLFSIYLGVVLKPAAPSSSSRDILLVLDFPVLSLRLSFQPDQLPQPIDITPSSPAVNTRDMYMWLSTKERTSHVLSAAGQILPFSNL